MFTGLSAPDHDAAGPGYADVVDRLIGGSNRPTLSFNLSSHSDTGSEGLAFDNILRINRNDGRRAGFDVPPPLDDDDDERADRQRRAGLEQDIEERAENNNANSGRQKYRRNTFGRVQDAYYCIFDRGDWYFVRGHDRVQSGNIYSPRKMTNAQLRKILIKLILEDGCDKIYFYRNNEIDFEAAGRARMMLATELNKTLERRKAMGLSPNVEIMYTLSEDPEPWASPYRRLVGHYLHTQMKALDKNYITFRRGWRETRGLWGVSAEPAGPEPN